MTSKLQIYSRARSANPTGGTWPHGYEDLDQRFFKRSRLRADIEEPGDGPDDIPPPQPEEGPAPPVHS